MHNVNYGCDFRSREGLKGCGRTMQALQEEVDPDIFRRNVKKMLEHNTELIEFALKYGVSPCKPVLNSSRPILRKISTVAANSRYAIVAFSRDDAGHRIPSLKIILEDGDSQFIRCQVPLTPPFVVRGKREADYLVSLLASSDISTDNSEGCDAKTELSCRFLRAMGVADFCVKKILVKGSLAPRRDDKYPCVSWSWHIAPFIVTQSKEGYVLDTFFDTTQALSVERWENEIGGRISKIKKVESNFSYDGKKDRFVLTTDTVFEQQVKRMSFHDFTPFLKQNGYIRKEVYKDFPEITLPEDQSEMQSSAVCAIS